MEINEVGFIIELREIVDVVLDVRLKEQVDDFSLGVVLLYQVVDLGVGEGGLGDGR